MRHVRRCCVLMFLALAAFSSPASAKKPVQAPARGASMELLDQAVGKENYVEAKKLADAILQRGVPDDRVKTVKVYGRILLALGQKELARQYLAMLSRPNADPTGGQLTAIYMAWFKALDGKPDDGIKAIEKIVEQAGVAPNETVRRGRRRAGHARHGSRRNGKGEKGG